MKAALKTFVAVLLLGSLTINAEPYKTWNWVGPDTYEDGTFIIADPLEYTLDCGTSAGGPYPDSIVFDLQTPPALQDMMFAVTGPGIYYCSIKAESSLYNSTSPYSNEVSFVVMPDDVVDNSSGSGCTG